MPIDEFIRSLQRIQKEIGNVSVQTSVNGIRENHPGPTIGFVKKLKRQETTPRFATIYDDGNRIGERICKV
ncbi:MAG: hypothetical protein V3S49_04930 [Thermodesulfobacteriota bacterium]